MLFFTRSQMVTKKKMLCYAKSNGNEKSMHSCAESNGNEKKHAFLYAKSNGNEKKTCFHTTR